MASEPQEHELPKRDWMEMTWQEIAGAGAATARWIAVLPLAAVEQHGPHLPLGVDTFIAEAYLARVPRSDPRRASGDVPADAAHRRLRRASRFPGTLTCRPATAIAAWTELGESLARAGLRKLVLVTSHGGNVAAMESVARDLRARLRHARGHRGLASLRLSRRDVFGRGKKARHSRRRHRDLADAGGETGHGVHGPGAQGDAGDGRNGAEFKWLGAYRPAGFAWMTQDLHPSGAVGDATLATAAKGDAALARGAQAFVELLREIDRFDLARLRDGPLD